MIYEENKLGNNVATIKLNDNFSIPIIQKKLRNNQYLYLEFYNDLDLIITKDNMYIENWEEGNYLMKTGLLQIMDNKEKSKYSDILYCHIKEDISTRYKILDNIFENCKYTTVKCWK